MKRHFLKILLLTAFLSASFSYLFAEPRIVVLKGTSCAGKSSLCREFQKYEEESWRVIEEDSYLFKNYIRLLSFYYPEESYDIFHAVGKENFVHATIRGQISFKKEASQNDRDKALLAIDSIQNKLNQSDISSQVIRHSAKELVADVQMALDQGKNVIIDTPSPGIVTAKISKTLFPKCSVISALVYCNLAKTLRHLEERNKFCKETGDFSSMRYYRQVLVQFHNLYAITLIADNSAFLEDISTFHNVFEDLQSKVVQTWDVEDLTKFPRREMNLLSLSEMEHKMFYYYPGMQQKTLYITPRENYDVVLNTGKDHPVGAAMQLREYLHQR